MNTAHKILGFLAILVGLFFSAQAVQAAQVTDFLITLGDTRPVTTTTHRFAFDHPTNDTLTQVKFRYCPTPSGSCGAISNLDTDSAAKGTFTSGLTAAEWSLNTSTPRTPILHHVGAGETVGAGATIDVTLTTIQNHGIDDCEAGGDASTDTCYVRLFTCSDNTDCNAGGTSVVDEGIASYTVIAEVAVTARVNPIFTFVISGVASGAVNNEITTSVASDFNTLPFSNLTAQTPRYAAHDLQVTTNTESGYSVTTEMIEQMTGVYSANNIDPFISTWATPTTWTEPTGSTPNDNTGWIGANTTDTDVGGWSSSPEQKFGPISSTAVTVSSEDGSDNGTSVYVTYGLEVNVFQPADTYEGKVQYTALPTY